MKLYNLPFYGGVYRGVMQLAHRFGWHYAPRRIDPDGSEACWCQWCGLRATMKPANYRPAIGNLNFDGDGRVSVPVEAIVKSPRVQAQVKAVREFMSKHSQFGVEEPKA